VLGDRGLGHVETAGDFTDGGRADGETFDDPSPYGMRECPE
jgi:hypothetical protein